MRHLMNPLDFSVEELDKLFALADDIEKDPAKYAHKCDGKILATCFYEPSTRTRLSFETAMTRHFPYNRSDPAESHWWYGCGAPPAIFGGRTCRKKYPPDSQHPTQTLADLQTIRSLHGDLNHFTIGLCGDLKFGRTVHSLINALVRYEGIKFIFISPEELKIPDYVTDMLREKGIPFQEVIRLEDVMPKLDLLYMTRVQKERFFNEEDYVRLKDFYVLTPEKMELAKPDMLVLHPLPRINEISVEIDDDPRAAYFKQAQFAVYVRMALILTLLGLA